MSGKVASDATPNIINRLNSGMKFGLYGSEYKCYFEDGSKVRYNDLWLAIQQIHNLHDGHGKTLPMLYPDTFEGIFVKKPVLYMYKRKVNSILRSMKGGSVN